MRAVRGGAGLVRGSGIFGRRRSTVPRAFDGLPAAAEGRERLVRPVSCLPVNRTYCETLIARRAVDTPALALGTPAQEEV